MRLIAVVLTVVLMLGIATCLIGCKDSASGADGDDDGMTTKELNKRGPQPPTGKKKNQDGTADQPTGPKSGG